MKDDLYFDWTVAVAIPGWPLMNQFNRHILYSMESGLYVYWEREVFIFNTIFLHLIFAIMQ